MRWAGSLLGFVVTIGVIAAVTISVSTLRWRRASSLAVAQLRVRRREVQIPPLAALARDDTARHPERSAPRDGTCHPERSAQREVEGSAPGATLPPVVARYFAFALRPDQRAIAHARITQRGEIAMPGKGWLPFDATEDFHVREPGFVWDAAVHFAPFIDVLVRDRYVHGAGSMLGRVAGVVTVVDQHGTSAMAEASLQRYLAEAVWLPTALLPSEGVVWTAIDDRTARATLVDHGVTASFDFQFGADGEIVGGTALRSRDVDGRMIPTTWDGRFSRYERVHGMMIPTHGDVGWILPEGRVSYWRGDLVRAEYELP